MAIEVYDEKKLFISTPSKKTGLEIHELINRSKPLDLNSSYLYFIQSHYFSKTCAIATYAKEVVGFVSGFISPLNHNTLFIWQVAIDQDFRGRGLALKLIQFILQQNNAIEFIETTVTQSNESSLRLFNKLSETLNTQIKREIFLDQQQHFLNQHDSEYLFRIGPFKLQKE
jgi:L-2,4-diaminobutyric acid acetyltransferase